MTRIYYAHAFALAAAILVVLCGVLGGSNFFFDSGMIRDLAGWRAANPDPTRLVILLTHLGGAPFLLSVLAIAALLTMRRSRRDAVLLLAIVLSGRLMVELIKWLVNRARPAFDEHPVTVFSQSFPSGHAGNSMVTYLAIAVVALPRAWRGPGVAGALLLSIAIGITRPILGVHWPTDVVGGWAFGLAWVWLCLEIAKRFRAS